MEITRLKPGEYFTEKAGDFSFVVGAPEAKDEIKKCEDCVVAWSDGGNENYPIPIEEYNINEYISNIMERDTYFYNKNIEKPYDGPQKHAAEIKNRTIKQRIYDHTTMFIFCPNCGTEIDWDKIISEYKGETEIK